MGVYDLELELYLISACEDLCLCSLYSLLNLGSALLLESVFADTEALNYSS